MRSSRVVRSLSLLIAFGVVHLTSTEASAQRRGADSIPSEVIESNTPPDAGQRRLIDSFVAAKATDLAESDEEGSTAARNALVAVARQRGVSGVFLRSYSDALLPALESIIEGDDAIRAENGLRVLAFLHTPEATGRLVESLDPKRIEDPSRRLVAAGLISIAVREVPQSGLGSAVLVSTARGIAEAAAMETDWLVVLEELRALRGVAFSSNLTPDNRGQVRRIQFDTIADVARRIEASEAPNPLIHAIYRASLGLRVKLLERTLAEDLDASEVSGVLRGTLVDVAGAAVKQWNGLDADPEMMSAYEGTLRIGTQLLTLLEERPDARFTALAAPLSAAIKAEPGSIERSNAKAALEAALAKAP